MGYNYFWLGTYSSDPTDWNVAANWEDLGTGLPASAPPTASDTVTIGPSGATIDITGSGDLDSASMTIAGPADLSGTFYTGALAVSGQLQLTGSIADSGAAAFADGTTLTGGATTVAGAASFGGAFTLGGGGLNLQGGGTSTGGGGRSRPRARRRSSSTAGRSVRPTIRSAEQARSCLRLGRSTLPARP